MKLFSDIPNPWKGVFFLFLVTGLAGTQKEQS